MDGAFVTYDGINSAQAPSRLKQLVFQPKFTRIREFNQLNNLSKIQTIECPISVAIHLK